MNLQQYTHINLGMDVERIIEDYVSQLEFTEKYNRVLQQFKETVRHQVINHSRSIILRNDKVIFYDYVDEFDLKSRMLIVENSIANDDFIIIESNFCQYITGWWIDIFRITT